MIKRNLSQRCKVFFFFNICKSISVTHQIIFNSEKLKPFPLRSGRRQAYLLSSLLFNTVLGVLANQKEKSKMNTNWKRKSKLLLFADDILCIADTKDAIRKLVECIMNSESCRIQLALLRWR